MVVADQVASHVEFIFTHYQELDGIRLMIGLFLFSVQIYCDFSGYSDIAIGVARLFGIRLSRNFAYPYFSRNIIEFWRRWNISLSFWFRDYVYIPLGGNRMGTARKTYNLFATFMLCGLWHGANWTYVAWGTLNALYYLPIQSKKKAKVPTKTIPDLREALSICFTFFMVMIAWTFFRAPTIADAVNYLGRIMTNFWDPTQRGYFGVAVLTSLCLLFVEWISRHQVHLLQICCHWPVYFRWLLYYSLVWLLFFHGNFGYVPFIYFQF
ncbi:MAG: MBOAT family O-acyltransferase [Deltaproteobacteria bacterium]|nr:MBOAT family O-acyltransferase [Deltaproteobacteria bacterium]